MSLDLLDQHERQLYAALAIFREDEPIHEAGIARLWQGLRQLDDDERGELLDDLQARALVDITRHETHRAVILHDLLRDLMRSEIGNQYIAAHHALLTAYRATCTGSGWHTAQNDGYLYDHLAYHLTEAGLCDELNTLFANHYWLHRRVPQRDYTYDGYIDDVMRAWHHGHQVAQGGYDPNDVGTAITECIRYALIRTTINAIAGNYVPTVVACAVNTSVSGWPVERAVSIARALSDQHARAEMYAALLVTDRLSSEQRVQCQNGALDAAFQIQDEGQRVEVLRQLAPQLDAQQLQQVLDAAFQIGDEGRRAELLGQLAPQLDAQQLQQTLNATVQIRNEWRRAWVLAALFVANPRRMNFTVSGAKTSVFYRSVTFC